MRKNAPADPTTLDADAFNLALHCLDTIVKFRAYTSGALMVMLLGKFRDDVRESHGKEPLLPAQRGSQHLPIGELESSDLDTLAGSAGTLLDQFAPLMDDPELPTLLRDFQDALNAEKAERAKPRAETAQDAKA
jgi:hypothetical protein